MACAPPILNTCPIPHSCAATSTAGLASPLRWGGVHSTRSAQPAMRAGTASMMTVDGSGAPPAGTYNPTAPIGRMSRSQRTPGCTSSDSSVGTPAR